MLLRVLLLLAFLGVTARLLKGRIGLAFVISAVAAGPLLGMDLVTTITHMGASVASISCLRLVIFVASIMFLSGLMAAVGSLEQVGEAVRGFLGSARGGMGLLPALVGLLPMPGGALFSAPLVDAAASGTTIDKTRRAVSNFWFRHIGEFWWPLYPGVIAALELSNIQWSTWAIRMMLLSPVAAAIGWIFILKPVARQDVGTGRNSRAALALAKGMMPILLVPLVVLVANLAKLVIPGWRPDSWVVLLLGVGAAIICVATRWRPSLPQWRAAFQKDRMRSMAFLIIALMAYKGVISESNMAAGMAEELASAAVPVLFIASVISFFGGLVTGIAVGFVGATFPIIVALFSNYHLDYTVSMGIAYVWGFIGMMVSPMHLCLLVTKVHFRADWKPLYKLLIPVALLTGIVSTAVLWGTELVHHYAMNDALISRHHGVGIVGTLRRGKKDKLFALRLPGSIEAPFLPGKDGARRWPLLHEDGRTIAFLEKDDAWRLRIGDLEAARAVTVADSISDAPAWLFWKPDAPPTLTACCRTVHGSRELFMWREGDAVATKLVQARGAHCPFWIGDSLAFFLPAEACWELGTYSLRADSLQMLCTGLPDLVPIDCVSHDSRLAYVATAPHEQPPRGRLQVLSMSTWELQEIDLGVSDLRAPAWSANGDLFFLAGLNSAQYLMQFTPGNPAIPELCSLQVTVRGAVLLPDEHLIIGIAPRKQAGSPYDLVMVGWDGVIIHRVSKRGKSFWGVSATVTPIDPDQGRRTDALAQRRAS